MVKGEINKPSGHIKKCTIYKGNRVVKIYNTRTRHVTDKEGEKITIPETCRAGPLPGNKLCKPGLRSKN